jgi:hypothetical protein
VLPLLLLQIKAWCYYESRLLGAHHGLISTYALETLVLYVFNKYHSSRDSPLAVSTGQQTGLALTSSSKSRNRQAVVASSQVPGYNSLQDCATRRPVQLALLRRRSYSHISCWLLGFGSVPAPAVTRRVHADNAQVFQLRRGVPNCCGMPAAVCSASSESNGALLWLCVTQVFYNFLVEFSNFDWDRYCLSLLGPVPLKDLPSGGVTGALPSRTASQPARSNSSSMRHA